MMSFPEIPANSVLGLNYSGMHDSAIAVVGPDGTPVFACALERLSRVKQDGRWPLQLLKELAWDRIAKVAITTHAAFEFPLRGDSQLLNVRLPSVRVEGLRHEQAFYKFLDTIPVKREFVCHQLAHAASAFWASGFETALCLTYDGGMHNSPWFGGLYRADRNKGLTALDQFSALHYAKVTSLYTFVTALLGFSPNKHEGKITGLAAYGVPSDACRALMRRWLEQDFLSIESTMDWAFAHSADMAASLLPNEARMEPFRVQAQTFSREELAATVQEMAEMHVLDLLERARNLGWVDGNICLAGGLFANVKINQKIVESGFNKLFVAPPMTDDGTAMGAAWHVLSREDGFNPPAKTSMYLGPSYSADHMERVLNDDGIRFTRLDNAPDSIAALLAQGHVVAMFQGAMEFGPRALGNRSILAQATESAINQSLNHRLHRTEFMPFAPVSRMEDADRCYQNIARVVQAAEFMTVTVDCTEEMKQSCPAVVHVDGTARPQLVTAQSNPLVHAILTRYVAATGKPALVNTSFNIHEEPIVCSPQDAIQGFFESELDYLCLAGTYLIAFKENPGVALKYLRNKTFKPNEKLRTATAIARIQSERLAGLESELQAKEEVIQQLKAQVQYLERSKDQEKDLLAWQSRTIAAYQMAYGGLSPLRPIARLLRWAFEIVRPRLGNLNQYKPRPLVHSKKKLSSQLGNYPSISIVIPSFQQAAFVERTLLSVLNQEYPQLELFVQDGGSKDGSVEVFKKYQERLSGWISDRDGGQSHAINLGFEKTSGEIMGWLNSDDLLLPHTLHRVADYFNRHPDVDVVYGNRLLIDESDMEIGRWIMPGHDSAVLSWVDYVPQETMFWRRRLWEKVGSRVDESFRFAMDWDLILRFREAGARFGHIPEFLGAFRIHERQKTSAAIHEVGHQEMNRIRERVLGRVPSRKEIRAATFPYLFKHIAIDMLYRVKVRIGWGI